MTTRSLHPECVTAPANATVLELAQEMDAEAVGTVVIVDDKQAPVGIVTDRDILCRVIAEGRDPEQTTAEQILSAPLVCAPTGIGTRDALEKMAERRVRRLPVVDEEGRLVRVLSLDEVVMGLSDELFNLGQTLRVELMRDVNRARGRRRREAREEALEQIRTEAARIGNQARSFLRDELQELVDRLGGRDRGAP